MTKDEFMQIHMRHRSIAIQTGEPFMLVDIIDQLEREFGSKKVKEYLKKLSNMGIK